MLRVPKCRDVEADEELGRDVAARALDATVGFTDHAVDGREVGPEDTDAAAAIVRAVAQPELVERLCRL